MLSSSGDGVTLSGIVVVVVFTSAINFSKRTRLQKVRVRSNTLARRFETRSWRAKTSILVLDGHSFVALDYKRDGDS